MECYKSKEFHGRTVSESSKHGRHSSAAMISISDQEMKLVELTYDEESKGWRKDGKLCCSPDEHCAFDDCRKHRSIEREFSGINEPLFP